MSEPAVEGPGGAKLRGPHRRPVDSVGDVAASVDVSERVLPDRETADLVLDQELKQVKALAVLLLVLSESAAT